MVRLKQAHRAWGPRKIRELYRRLYGAAPSSSSCKRILTKAGLVQVRRRRPDRPNSERLSHKVAAKAPNDVWTVDFKGWWKTGAGQRCEPLTVRDAYSRFVLGACAMPTNATDPVRYEFERLFKEYGLPAVIRSDNGSPFASSNGLLGLTRLSAWWLVLGIDLDRIRPGHPEENGGHERMHRDIAHEIEGLVSGDLGEHHRRRTQPGAPSVLRMEQQRVTLFGRATVSGSATELGQGKSTHQNSVMAPAEPRLGMSPKGFPYATAAASPTHPGSGYTLPLVGTGSFRNQDCRHGT